MKRLAILISLLLVSCGNPPKGFSETSFTSIAFVNQLVLHFDSELTSLERSNAILAATNHNTAFLNQIYPIVQSAAGGSLPTPTTRQVWVYNSPYIHAPNQLASTGWIDFDSQKNDIHVSIGPGSILPDLTKLITLSYYHNVPAFNVIMAGQTMTFWAYVDLVNADVMKYLKFVRNVP